MVDITPPVADQRQLIQSYGGGGFRIAGEDYNGSVLVEAERTYPWPVTDPAAISHASLKPLIKTLTERFPGGAVLLLGMGVETVAIDENLRVQLRKTGIGLEVMGTGPACRTFNVLLAEDRAVAAALIAIP